PTMSPVFGTSSWPFARPPLSMHTLAAFHQLILNLPLMDKALTLQLYIQGLKLETCLAVEMQDLKTIAEAEKQALHVDNIKFLKNINPCPSQKPQSAQSKECHH